MSKAAVSFFFSSLFFSEWLFIEALERRLDSFGHSHMSPRANKYGSNGAGFSAMAT